MHTESQQLQSAASLLRNRSQCLLSPIESRAVATPKCVITSTTRSTPTTVPALMRKATYVARQFSFTAGYQYEVENGYIYYLEQGHVRRNNQGGYLDLRYSPHWCHSGCGRARRSE